MKSPFGLRAVAWSSLLLDFLSQGLLFIDGSLGEEFGEYSWGKSLLELWIMSVTITLIIAIAIEGKINLPKVVLVPMLGAFYVYSIFKGVYFLGFARSTHIPCFILNILCPLCGAVAWMRADRLSLQYRDLRKQENEQCDPLLKGQASPGASADKKSKPSIGRLLGMGE